MLQKPELSASVMGHLARKQTLPSNFLYMPYFYFLFLYCQGVFAIVEFTDEESVTRILHQESLPLLHDRRLTVKERTVNKVSLQNKTPRSKKSKPANDAQQHLHRPWQNREIAAFLSEEIVNKLKSSVYTVCGNCYGICYSSWFEMIAYGINHQCSR